MAKDSKVESVRRVRLGKAAVGATKVPDTPRCPVCGARNPHGTTCQKPKK